MIVKTKLWTMDSRVLSPEGVVYSTDPRTAEGENGVSYFTKGPNIEIVFAEIAGCMLPREVGLLVPDVAACEFGDETYAGSAKVADAVRNIEPWLHRRQRVKNFEDLFSTAVVDIWLANKDRNIGNVLGDPRLGHGRLDLVFIDFEKSQALRRYPTVSTPMLEPRQLWPSGVLGHELRLQKPLLPPSGTIEQIHSLSTERCAAIINDVEVAIGVPIEWKDGSIYVLSQRAARIQHLAEVLWAMN